MVDVWNGLYLVIVYFIVQLEEGGRCEVFLPALCPCNYDCWIDQAGGGGIAACELAVIETTGLQYLTRNMCAITSIEQCRPACIRTQLLRLKTDYGEGRFNSSDDTLKLLLIDKDIFRLLASRHKPHTPAELGDMVNSSLETFFVFAVTEAN